MRVNLVIIFVFVYNPVECYRILGIFPHTAKSHDFVFNSLMQGLAEKGHEITVISHFSYKDQPKNYKHINLRGSLPILEDVFTFEMMKSPRKLFDIDQIAMHLETIWILSVIGNDSCRAVLANDEVNSLAEGQFDLAIVETFNSDCGLGIVDHLKVPFIGFSSHAFMPWTMKRLGLSQNPSYKPFHFLGFGRYPDFLQTVKSFLYNQMYTFIYYNVHQKNDIATLEEHYKKDFSNIEELAESMGLTLVSTYFPFHGSYDVPPNVVEIGGIHIKKSNALPKDLQKYMDESKNGVIIFSMGSMLRATSWPADKLKAFQDAFAKLPLNILWKWEEDDMPGKPSNVKTVQWIPQFDLLNHPNTKAMISHAGGLGLSEAVHSGVPVLAIPIYGDQAHNAAAAKDSKIGEVLDYEDITTENILESLGKILDPKIQQNAKRLSEIWKDRPNTALETGIFWVEHVIRHGSKHLRPVSADLPLYRYLLIDVILFIVLIILVVFYGIKFLCIKMFSKSKKVHKHKNGIVKNVNVKKKD